MEKQSNTKEEKIKCIPVDSSSYGQSLSRWPLHFSDHLWNCVLNMAFMLTIFFSSKHLDPWQHGAVFVVALFISSY